MSNRLKKEATVHEHVFIVSLFAFCFNGMNHFSSRSAKKKRAWCISRCVFDCRTLWFAVHCKSFSNLGDIDQSANGLQGDLHQISAA